MLVVAGAVVARFLVLHEVEAMSALFAHYLAVLNVAFIATFNSLVTLHTLTGRMVEEVRGVIFAGRAHVGAREDRRHRRVKLSLYT